MNIGPIEIFYDGSNIEKYGVLPYVKGITTNCSIFSKSGYKSYADFFEKYQDIFKEKPVSLQTWDDDSEKMIEQVKQIHSIHPSIYVKIPIVNTKGQYTENVIQYAVENCIPINITILHTKEQVLKAYDLVKESRAPIIISLFVGPVMDTFADGEELIRFTVHLFKEKKNCKILFAGCREVYAIKRANDLGCHIITIPDAILEKASLFHGDLQELTLARARLFHKDASCGNFTILN
jgi:transaldolase